MQWQYSMQGKNAGFGFTSWIKILNLSLSFLFFVLLCYAVLFIPITYVFYNWKVVPLMTFTYIAHSPAHSPLSATNLFSVSVSLFVLCVRVFHILHVNQNHTLVVFIWLILLTVILCSSIHVANGTSSFFFMTENILLCVCTTSPISVHLWMDTWVASIFGLLYILMLQ